jgi:hypothetical protein
VVETQSHIIDATIDLRPDETAAHSSAVISTAGEEGEPMKAARDLGEGAIYWSPRIPSSIEQAIARARILDKPLSKIPGASLYSGSRPEITVERVDPTHWAKSIWCTPTNRAVSCPRPCGITAWSSSGPIRVGY